MKKQLTSGYEVWYDIQAVHERGRTELCVRVKKFKNRIRKK